MICLRCDNEEFVVKRDAVIEQEFKGRVRIRTDGNQGLNFVQPLLGTPDNVGSFSASCADIFDD